MSMLNDSIFLHLIKKKIRFFCADFTIQFVICQQTLAISFQLFRMRQSS